MVDKITLFVACVDEYDHSKELVHSYPASVYPTPFNETTLKIYKKKYPTFKIYNIDLSTNTLELVHEHATPQKQVKVYNKQKTPVQLNEIVLPQATIDLLNTTIQTSF